MKNLILVVFLITLSNSITAQDFVPIPADSTSHWKVDGYYLLGGICIFNYSYWYYINGEEMINGKKFSKLYSKGHWNEAPIWPDDDDCNAVGDILDVYEGALRTEDNLVYFKPSGENKVQLLFDYNLKTGDTLPDTIIFNRGFNYDIIVGSMDTVQMESGEHRTRWNLELENYGMPLWFIEGIGTNKGLFHTLIPFEWDSELTCYSERFGPFYPPGYICDPTIGVRNSKTDVNVFKIFPNPSSRIVRIEIQNPRSERYLIEVHTLTGQQILTQHIEESEEPVINCQKVSPGIYLLTVKLNNGYQSTRKLIIN